MNNWELVKKEIKEKAGTTYGNLDGEITYEQAVANELMEISKTTNIFKAIDWLTQEAESEIPDWIDNPNANPDNEFEIPKAEPQQSKARFVWAGDDLINTNLIDHISFNTDGTPVFYTIGGAVKHTDKETLKQLGIEVV